RGKIPCPDRSARVARMALGRGNWRLILLGALALLGAAGYYGVRQLWAGYHYRLALQAQQERDFAQAADHLERALTVWPHDPAMHLLSAQAARRQGDMDSAVPHLRECTQQTA